MDGLGVDGIPNLSVIRYDTNRDIVLRHADAIVVLDPETKQLVPHSREHGIDNRSHRPSLCPTCRRPWMPQASSSSQNAGSSPPSGDEPNFITNDYFHMLARSLPGSAQPSPPPSPRRQLAQPVRTGRLTRSRHSSNLASAGAPPLDAEFVSSTPAPPTSTGISSSAFAQDYFSKFFTVERELGRGGRGVVLLVQHTLDGVPLGHFACKRVRIGDDHAWLEKVLVEVQLLTQLSHQNLVSYRHVWLEDFQINAFSPSVPCAFILQQFCNGGDLHNYICGGAQSSTTTQQIKERFRRRSRGEAEIPQQTQAEPKRLHFDEIYSFFRDITAGLRFLHLHGFVHRDLKPSNCLLHHTGHETRVLVSDFGEAQYEYIARNSTGATGTISYCAPEVLMKVNNDGPFGDFTFKSDIFSLGMILHFLCFADLPYKASDVLHEEKEDIDTLRAEIVSWEGFDDQKRLRPELPSELYAFLKRLLSLNPDQRPSVEEVDRGVSTGRLSDNFPGINTRRRSSTREGPEELTPNRRIQKLDTPTQGNSPQRGAPVGRGLGLPPERHVSQRRPRSRSHERRRSKLSIDTAIDDSSDHDYLEDQEDTPTSNSNSHSQSPSNQLSDSETNPFLASSVVLRPRPHVASALPSPSNTTNDYSAVANANRDSKASSPLPSPTDRRKPQLLLPPPDQSSTLLSPMTRLLTLPISSPTFRAVLLTLKLLSTLHPCISLSTTMNASIIYPLLTLAVVEFTLPPQVYKLWTAILLGVLHVGVLVAAISQGALCSIPSDRLRRPWDEVRWEGERS